MNQKELKVTLSSILGAYIPEGAEVAYVDFPVYSNVGDQYIFMGVMSFLKTNKNKIKYAGSVSGFNESVANSCVKDDTIILCQGGGNFGDLYRIHQELRNRVVQLFSTNRIVFLPQSVYYNSNAILSSDMEILKKHKKLSILVRDNESRDLLVGYGLDVILCPDTAHFLYESKNAKGDRLSANKVLYFLRQDIEKINTQVDCQYNSVDWPDLLTKFDTQVCLRALRWLSVLSRKLGVKDISFYLSYYYYSFSVKPRVDKYFKKYHKVVTSRLHGYIIAMLNGCDVETLDNSYGKIGKYKRYINSLRG